MFDKLALGRPQAIISKDKAKEMEADHEKAKEPSFSSLKTDLFHQSFSAEKNSSKKIRLQYRPKITSFHTNSVFPYIFSFL